MSTFYSARLCALQQIKPITSNISVLLFKTSMDAHTWALILINENVKGFQLMSCEVLSILTALCYDC